MPSLSVPNTLRLDGAQLQLSRTDRESLKLGARQEAAFLRKGQRPMAGGVDQPNHCVVQSLKGRGIIHEGGQVCAGAVHRVVSKTFSLSSIGIPADLEPRYALPGAGKILCSRQSTRDGFLGSLELGGRSHHIVSRPIPDQQIAAAGAVLMQQRRQANL